MQMQLDLIATRLCRMPYLYITIPNCNCLLAHAASSAAVVLADLLAPIASIASWHMDVRDQ